MSFTTRRDVLRSLGSATISSAIPKMSPRLHDARSVISRQLPPGVEDARALINHEISHDAATGVAVALVRRGKIEWEEGFGWADRERGLRAAASTPFTLASITKPFTATTLMTLVAEGGLCLDVPANRYLPKHQTLHGHGYEGRVTVRLLGAHVSGLPTMYEGYDLSEASSQPSSEALLHTFGRLAYPPEACYEYSNIGFSALAAIATNHTRSDFGTLLHHRVLGPLGLQRSFFGVKNAPSTAAARYSASGELVPFYTTSTPASGELYASAHDLALFAIFNMNGRSGDHDRILGPRWIAELHKPVFAGRSGVASTFGWFRTHLKSGTAVISKIGGQPGVATALYMVPSQGLACLVLTNRSNGRDLCNNVCNSILSRYLPDWQLPEETCSPRPLPFVPISTFLGQWEGSLEKGDEHIDIHLNVGPGGTANIAISDEPSVQVDALQAEGGCLTGTIAARIGSTFFRQTQPMTLQIKLCPSRGRLTGRILANAGDPNVKNVMLPYVLNLRRA